MTGSKWKGDRLLAVKLDGKSQEVSRVPEFSAKLALDASWSTRKTHQLLLGYK